MYINAENAVDRNAASLSSMPQKSSLFTAYRAMDCFRHIVRCHREPAVDTIEFALLQLDSTTLAFNLMGRGCLLCGRDAQSVAVPEEHHTLGLSFCPLGRLHPVAHARTGPHTLQETDGSVRGV